MVFKRKKKAKDVPAKLPRGILKEDYKLTFNLAVELNKHFKDVIKAVVLFGSVAKRIPKRGSDIDIAILVDDASIQWDRQAIAWYREELKKIVGKIPNGERFHVNTITVSSFWDNLLVGEPAVINILRYGVGVLDTGFFEPLKFLLYRGRVKPTPEAVYNCASRVSVHIFRGKVKMLSAIGDFYWACVDAAHAPLMQHGEIPPSPEHVAELLNRVFVKKRKLSSKYVAWYSELYELAHKIKDNQIKDLSASEYKKWLERTEDFTQAMHKLMKFPRKKK